MEEINKNFGFSRKSGILVAVSSLPSKYGIGTFGAPSKRFIDFLKKTDTKCWQILPLSPTGYGDSPYQSPSAFAGDPYYIDPETLNAKGLITKKELQGAKIKKTKTDYGFCFATKFDLFKKAYSRFKPTPAFKKFDKENASWLDDYAYFMALKEHFSYKPFCEWPEEYKFYENAKNYRKNYINEINFWKFLQFEFFAEWNEVRSYAKKKGITIIGDMPIYVAYDSADVWSNIDLFLLDENLAPTLVSGVPPDAFSDDGQLWGNPIYNYEKMSKDGFNWWIKRVRQNQKLYDIVRIDHFRGFAGYYVIGAKEKTAKNGHWEVGPGKELFRHIKDALPDAKIIAEDLGYITPDVRELLDFCGYPGMKILQFAFGNDDNEYLPRMYKNSNCVVYTGSHDSECSASWIRELKGAEKARYKKEIEKIDGPITYSLIKACFDSIADLVVIPMQDWLNLTNKARMNTPSIAEGNWTWRLPKNYDREEIIKVVKKFVKNADRK